MRRHAVAAAASLAFELTGMAPILRADALGYCIVEIIQLMPLLKAAWGGNSIEQNRHRRSHDAAHFRSVADLAGPRNMDRPGRRHHPRPRIPRLRPRAVAVDAGLLGAWAGVPRGIVIAGVAGGS